MIETAYIFAGSLIAGLFIFGAAFREITAQNATWSVATSRHDDWYDLETRAYSRDRARLMQQRDAERVNRLRSLVLRSGAATIEPDGVA